MDGSVVVWYICKKHIVMEWISVKDRLPETNQHNESEYLLCYEKEYNQTVVCWYNSRQDEWIVAHYRANSLPINISHWMPLPEKPKQ